MILVMTILAKNEEDVIKENIAYHLSQGVDFFIVTDNGSQDATTAILKKYETDGVLKYIREEGPYSQSKWVSHMAGMAYSKLGADWVINNDADEFWWPTTDDNLKQTLEKIPPASSVVRVQRHNMLISNQHEGQSFLKRNIYRRVVSLNSLGAPLPPKVCHRGIPSIHVAAGAHQVFAEKHLNVVDGEIEIFHYPVRSFRQFKNKIYNIGSGYEKNPQIDPITGARPGNVIRTLFEEYKQDPSSLVKQYERYTLSRKQLLWKRITGEIVKDDRLSVYFDSIVNPQTAIRLG